MNLEEQIRRHKEISLQIEELEAQRKALGQSILQAMSGKALQMGAYLVRRCCRLCISSTIDQARPYNATRMEEVIDKEKLKELHASGTSIEGIKEIEYIQISINK